MYLCKSKPDVNKSIDFWTASAENIICNCLQMLSVHAIRTNAVSPIAAVRRQCEQPHTIL
jgi:hypothetical protein